MNKNLEKSLKEQKKQNEQTKQTVLGTLGIPLGGQRLVEVPNRNSFVYVQLRSNQNEVIQAFNNKVAPSYGLPVMVQREGTRYIILGVDTQRYQNNWNSFAPYLARHGNTHSFVTDVGGGGGDITWVYSRQFMPLLTIPSGSVGGPNVVISPHVLESISGTWAYVGNTGTLNLLQYLPTGSNAVMILVYLDRMSGNPYLVVGSGSYFDNSITGTAQVTPYIPNVQNPLTDIPLSAIRLTTGTNLIGWDNIYDVRQYLQYITTGTGGIATGTGGSSIDTIGFAGLYSGVSLGTGTFLNVRGNNVTFTKSGSMFDLFVTGTSLGVDQIGFFALEEGVPLGTGTRINFVGANVDATISGTTVRVFVTGSPPFMGVDQIGIYGLANGVPLGTGTWVDFGNNLTTTISGTTIRVDAQAGGGSSSSLLIYDDSVFVATGTKISFNKNLNVYSTGTSVFVEAPITTYFRVGQPSSLGGGFYQVPDRVYASGSLGVFLDGFVRTPVIDYVEQLWVSGTYRLFATGTTQVVHYGVPCSPQTQPSTGTAVDMTNWLTDSEGVLLTDSEGVQLTDSNG